MCDCKDVQMGSFDNQVTLQIPPGLEIYKNTPWKERRFSVDVDTCLADEIQELWKAHVRTQGCCCGHNIQGVRPMINVHPDDYEKCIEMGYKKYVFPHDPDRCDTIIPKSVVNKNVINIP